jgi:hypothetical protein
MSAISAMNTEAGDVGVLARDKKRFDLSVP